MHTDDPPGQFTPVSDAWHCTPLLPWDATAGSDWEDRMYRGFLLTRPDRRTLLAVLVLAIVVAALMLAAATGHHEAVPRAATAIEYGL